MANLTAYNIKKTD